MEPDRPTISIMGSGGVGGYFGACLARAGFPVTFIARGAHLDAIRQNGLVVECPDETFAVAAPATEDPGEIGAVDFVFFSVKLWDTEEAARACRPLVGPGTAVVSLQNGIDSEDILQAVLGVEHVMGGVAEISATISAPGRISKVSPFSRIRFGELDNQVTERVQRLARCLSEAAIDHQREPDIHAAIWNKFIFLTGLSAMTALTRMPVGAIRKDAETRALLEQVMHEVVDVARAKGINLSSGAVAERMRMIDTLPEDMRASMAIDLSQGRRLELPWLSGAVVRLGAELGISVQANDFICKALKLHQNGRT